MTKESYIPVDAHDILRDYAAGPHYTNDLMVGTANKVEKALKSVGADFPDSGYSVGMLTRLYSYNEVSHFPDNNLRYLRDPAAFRREIVDPDSSVSDDIRRLYREEVAVLCGKSIDDIEEKDIIDFHRKRIATLI
jgi:hypothetical protein